jgi:hypothetical protein
MHQLSLHCSWEIPLLKNVLATYSYSQNGAPAIGLQQLTPTTSSDGSLSTITGSAAPTGVLPPPGASTGDRTSTHAKLGGGDITQTTGRGGSQTSTASGSSSGADRGAPAGLRGFAGAIVAIGLGGALILA